MLKLRVPAGRSNGQRPPSREVSHLAAALALVRRTQHVLLDGTIDPGVLVSTGLICHDGDLYFLQVLGQLCEKKPSERVVLREHAVTGHGFKTTC